MLSLWKKVYRKFKYIGYKRILIKGNEQKK